MYIIYKLVPIDDEHPQSPPESKFSADGIEYGRWHVEHTFDELSIVKKKIDNYRLQEKDKTVCYNYMLV